MITIRRLSRRGRKGRTRTLTRARTRTRTLALARALARTLTRRTPPCSRTLTLGMIPRR